MKRIFGAAVAATFAFGALPAAAAAAPAPVVVELYQSQGCSSCPPANAWANAVAARDDVLVLSFAVTYWDQLGWKDVFASPAHTDRQRAYASAIDRAALYTPEVVVNGRAHVTGSNRDKLDAVLAAGGKDRPAIAVSLSADAASIAAATVAKGAEVWLVRYDPRTVEVPIRAGENGGRTLPHRNVVRQLVKLGRYDGSAARFALPAAPLAGLRTAVLVQAGPGGAIIGAARG